MTLDPSVAQFLVDLLSADHPVPPTPEGFREDVRAFFAQVRPANLPAVLEAIDLDIPTDDGATLKARLYRPPSPQVAVVLYFHGGGWTTGDIDTHDEIARALAHDTGCRVLSVDFRRAPENPFPRPLLDCLAAWSWITAGSGSIVGLADDVALAGDSSGGNLAAALSLLLRDTGQRGPSAQLLIYPALDLTLATSAGSLTRAARGYWLTADDVRLFSSFYVPNDADRRDRLVSPLLAQSHHDLPRTMIVTAGNDPIRDDGDMYGRVLADSGATVWQLHFGAMIHGFIEFAPTIPAAMRARSEVFTLFGQLLRYCGEGD